MIIIGYDGSPGARAAVRQAGTLLPGYAAVVLTVSESEDLRGAARQHAADGARLARELGIDATSRVRELSGTIAATILSEASRLNGHAIVVGRHGVTSQELDGCAGAMGSVSEAVMRGASCAVLIAGSSDRQRMMAPSLLMGSQRG